MIKPVRKAVFPVAGLGTRFLPATKAMAKEMLPVVDKPLIQYAVEEAAAAGITEMIFVTSAPKTMLEDHFDDSPELEHELEAKGKTALLEVLHSIRPAGVKVVSVRQGKPLGLGHAVLCAKEIVGDEPFAVILPDDLIDADVSATRQLCEARQAAGGGSVIAVQDVPREKTSSYGIASVTDVNGRRRITGLVEKPKPEVAPSTLAVVGRYVLEPEIFAALEHTGRGAGGEIQLTDGLAACLESTPTWAVSYEGTRYDCGSKLGFLQATVALARKRGFDI